MQIRLPIPRSKWQSNRLQMLLQHKTLNPVLDDPCWEYIRSFVRSPRQRQKKNPSAFHSIFTSLRTVSGVWSCRRFYSNRKTEIKTELRMLFLCSLFTVFSIMLCLTKCAFAKKCVEWKKSASHKSQHHQQVAHATHNSTDLIHHLCGMKPARMLCDKCFA